MSNFNELIDKIKAIDVSITINDEIEKCEREIIRLTKEINKLIALQKHSEIRRIFNSIIQRILNTNALISIKQNKNGNIEFEANYQNTSDLSITAEDYGNTYRKILCIAFDLSILIYYNRTSFFHFVYHDGAIEGLDNRKKINFINTIKEICQSFNIQYILTLIDSDLPYDSEHKAINFSPAEICLKLHDKDDSGKIFLTSF